VLLGFAGGILLGLAARGSPWLNPVIGVADVVGAVFVSAIRMTVIPLVTAMLIAGLGSSSGSSVLSGLRSRAIAMLMLPVSAAIFALFAGQAALGLMPIDVATANELRASASIGAAGAAVVPTLTSWLIDLVPTNVFKAAADGALLPLIVFTIPFALAVSRLAEDRRLAITTFFSAIADAMLIVVRWIVAFAPIGVMALTAPIAARLGISVAGLLANYIVVSVVLTLIALAIIVYPMASIIGRVPVSTFARACVPAQSLAISSRSTMATLPAMMDAARGLGVPEAIVAVVVPLAASLLRVGSAVGQMVAVLFAAQLFGVTLAPAQMVSVLVTTIFTTVASPGVPGGSIIVMTPVLVAAGIPAGAIGILLGADAIPDMIRTMANVTGGIAATVMVRRPSSSGSSAP
jgi:proton glutamate symport protein